MLIYIGFFSRILGFRSNWYFATKGVKRNWSEIAGCIWTKILYFSSYLGQLNNHFPDLYECFFAKCFTSSLVIFPRFFALNFSHFSRSICFWGSGIDNGNSNTVGRRWASPAKTAIFTNFIDVGRFFSRKSLRGILQSKIIQPSISWSAMFSCLQSAGCTVCCRLRYEFSRLPNSHIQIKTKDPQGFIRIRHKK